MSGLIVTCQSASVNGYVAGTTFPGTPVDGVTIIVNNGATVGTGAGPSPLLSAGLTSAVNNQGTISDLATNTAINLGGGSSVTNAVSASGGITGIISLGATAAAQTNTVNNYAASGITGDIDSAGSLVINNTSTITGNINDPTGSATITNTGPGGIITGDITLGTGNHTIINTGTITGNVDMGTGINNFSASAAAELPTGTLTATADTQGNNTLTLTGTTAEILNKTVTNFDFLEKTGTGSWSINTPIALTNEVDVLGGTLIVPNATNLGANTVVNNATVEFTNQGTGTYSGNMSGSGTVLVDTGASITTFSGVNTYTGGTTINAGTLSVSGGAALADNGDVTIGAAGTLDVETTETIGGLFGSGAVTLTAGNLIINNGLFSGVISGANGIEKVGTGTLTLTSANTFTGTATVTNGTLELQNAAAVPGAVVVNAGTSTFGTLLVTNAATIGSLAGNGGAVVLNADLTTGSNNASTEYDGVISGTGSLTKIGTGTFILTGTNTYSGGTTITAGTLQLGNGGATGSIVGDIVDNAALVANNAGTIELDGIISGTGTVTQTGPGNLILTGANTYSGGTNLNGGTLTLGSNTAAGSGAIAMADGSTLAAGADGLDIANAITLAGSDTINNNGFTLTLDSLISGAGTLVTTGSGTTILTAANTYSGGTTVAGGTLQGTTTSLQGNILDNASLVFSQPGAGTFVANISGSGALTVTGGGNVTFTGSNTYSGPTHVTGTSTFTATGGTSIGDASDVTVDLGSTLVITTTETIGSLGGSGTVTVGTALTTGDSNNGSTFSGTLNGGDLNKEGTGDFNFAGAGTIVNLNVDAGSMDVSGAMTASGAATVGGALSVDGAFTVTGNTSVASGGSLTVNGTMSTAELDIASGGAGTIGASGVLTAPAVNDGLLTVNGSLVGDVTNNTDGTLNGAGTVTGNVTNNGIIAPGNSPGILTISGAYVQSATGVYAADITNSAVAGTGYDQIHVTGAPGTATLGGTLALAVTPGFYVNGTTYNLVDAAGGISSAFATVTGTQISTFVALTPTGGTGIVNVGATEQVYQLTVTRTSYASGIGASATPNQIAVANGFQNLVATPSGDALTLVLAVDNMTIPQAESFFDQASPEPYGAYATALQDSGELFTRQVALHMQGDQAGERGVSFWGTGYYGPGTGNHQSYRFGSNQDLGGGAVGMDFTLGDVLLGVDGGWSQDQLKYQLGNSKGHANSAQIGGYASYQSGPFDMNLQLVYIDDHFGATKTIDVATIDRSTQATFNGHLFKFVGTFGYDTSVDEFTLRPFIGIDYASGQTSSFSETGADAANLTVAPIDADKTNLMLGIDLLPSAQGFSPYGRLAYLYDVNNGRRNITAFFNGDPTTAFTVSGVRPDQSEFDIDAGVNYALTDFASLYVGYQGSIRSDLNRHGVSAGLTLRFGEAAAPPPPPPEPPPAPPPPPPPPPPVKTFIVFFDFDKSDLTDQAQQVVAQAVTAAKAGGFVKVLVTGHTDTVGSDTYNQALSIRRAQTVKDEMVHEGLDTNGIGIEGKSFHDPLVQTGPGVREPQNRRAVIDLGG